MKKVLVFLLVAAMMLSMACANTAAPAADTSAAAPAAEPAATEAAAAPATEAMRCSGLILGHIAGRALTNC